ncbi:MAG: hypothetical protein J6W12_04010 [Bacteroidales bacterium]|nr:hypothetical protein [Bacteroidales bacterium]
MQIFQLLPHLLRHHNLNFCELCNGISFIAYLSLPYALSTSRCSGILSSVIQLRQRYPLRPPDGIHHPHILFKK